MKDMKRIYGVLILALSLLAMALTASLAVLCMYLDRLPAEFYPMVGPYLRDMALPLGLEGVCALLGLGMAVRGDKPPAAQD